MERRFFSGEVRIIPSQTGDNRKIRGYAALFNVFSEDLGGFIEVIEPGAFDGVLGDDVRALSDHVSHRILGRSKAGTLRLWTDEMGLGYEVDVPDTTVGRDLVVSIQRGDVDQSSFGFSIPPEGDVWIKRDDGGFVRRIKRVGRLYDVSPVTFPAYLATSTEMRSIMNVPVLPDQARGAAAGSVDNSADVALRAQANQRQRDLEVLTL
jgi:HK97 family phage prohead protease